MKLINLGDTLVAKLCPKCGEVYTSDTSDGLRCFFHYSVGRPDGFQNACKRCQRERVLVGRLPELVAFLGVGPYRSLPYAVRKRITICVEGGGVVGLIHPISGEVQEYPEGRRWSSIEDWKASMDYRRIEFV